MYALFKQGTQDPPFDKADKPGMFDLKVRSSSSCDLQGWPADDRLTGQGKVQRVGEEEGYQAGGCAEAVRRIYQEDARQVQVGADMAQRWRSRWVSEDANSIWYEICV